MNNNQRSIKKHHRKVLFSMVLISAVAVAAFVPKVFAIEPSVLDNDHDNDDHDTGGSNDTNMLLLLHNVTVQTPQQTILDEIEDSFFDALSRDPSCDDDDCWQPPQSTVEVDGSATATADNDAADATDAATCVVSNPERPIEDQQLDLSSSHDVASSGKTCQPPVVDKHWGSDPVILRMRDRLREAGSVASSTQRQDKKDDDNDESSSKNSNDTSQKKAMPKNKRPPIFLLPGLASTRLISWKFKKCPQHPLLSDIKVLDIAWLNINLVFQMGTFESSCLRDCLALGLNQSDTDDLETGCKLRPDEGLDAISSLSPGGIGSELLVGGTNTVYAWLIQWLADNLGYDVTNIIGLPYDWRLSPQKMEQRDGFLTLTRRRIEAAVKSNGKPGIMVAHSMGNVVFRYFLEWLRQEMREESYEQYVKRAERRVKKLKQQQQQLSAPVEAADPSLLVPGWMNGVVSGFDEWWAAYFAARGKDDAKQHQNDGPDQDSGRHPQLWELAQIEGDGNWIEWLEEHIWTYVGLSAPMLGATNPLRAVISGENMGLPISDEVARAMEVTFGSTHSINTISSKSGFCDQWDVNDAWDEHPSETEKRPAHTRLECLDDLVTEIESGEFGDDPWNNYPALKSLLKERVDWDSDFPMMEITVEECQARGKEPCLRESTIHVGPRHVETGEIFDIFNNTFKEENVPLQIKREQLEESFWNSKVPNQLNHTWE